MDRGLRLVQYLFSDLMDESITPDNEFLFNKIKDLESASAPSPSYHPGAGETSVESGGGIDYDHIYIGGIEYTPGENTNDYDFLQIGADGSSSWIEAMISPMPTGYEIYNIRKNHIHITGATAGNI